MTNTWRHADLFRLSHPKGVDPRIGKFILKGEITDDAPDLIRGFGEVQSALNATEVVSLLNIYKKLPWEAIPTQFLKDAEVWKTLFYNGQLNGQALVRNVTRLAKIDAFKDMVFARDYAEKLTDEQMIAKTRLHPINYLNAGVVYDEGQISRDRYLWSLRRAKNWNTESVIKDALKEGFHLAFKHTEPAGKRTLIGLDVSDSMSSPALGLDLSCAQVGAAVAMTIARTEPYYKVMGFADEFRDLGISPSDNLNNIMQKTKRLSFGATDCSLPMTWAAKNNVEVDTFVVLTDNETWAGRIKPFQALKQYRDKTGIPARLAVLGVAATDFTIADPTMGGEMLDFVGFDSNVPKVLADFSARRI